jgi:hypothetical protein
MSSDNYSVFFANIRVAIHAPGTIKLYFCRIEIEVELELGGLRTADAFSRDVDLTGKLLAVIAGQSAPDLGRTSPAVLGTIGAGFTGVTVVVSALRCDTIAAGYDEVSFHNCSQGAGQCLCPYKVGESDLNRLASRDGLFQREFEIKHIWVTLNALPHFIGIADCFWLVGIGQGQAINTSGLFRCADRMSKDNYSVFVANIRVAIHATGTIELHLCRIEVEIELELGGLGAACVFGRDIDLAGKFLAVTAGQRTPDFRLTGTAVLLTGLAGFAVGTLVVAAAGPTILSAIDAGFTGVTIVVSTLRVARAAVLLTGLAGFAVIALIVSATGSTVCGTGHTGLAVVAQIIAAAGTAIEGAGAAGFAEVTLAVGATTPAVRWTGVAVLALLACAIAAAVAAVGHAGFTVFAELRFALVVAAALTTVSDAGLAGLAEVAFIVAAALTTIRWACVAILFEVTLVVTAALTTIRWACVAILFEVTLVVTAALTTIRWACVAIFFEVTLVVTAALPAILFTVLAVLSLAANLVAADFFRLAVIIGITGSAEVPFSVGRGGFTPEGTVVVVNFTESRC